MSGASIGSIAGFAIGSAFGPFGAQIGTAIGGVIGGYLMPTKIKGPSIGEAQEQTSAAGIPRPVVFGRPAPFRGNLIDGERKARKITKEVEQGKGAPTVSKEDHFLLTSAIRVCEGPIGGYLRVWRNEIPVIDNRRLQDIPGWDDPDPEVAAAIATAYNDSKAQTAKWKGKIRLYLGDEAQLPDPALEAIHGVGNTPYYRGTAYMVVESDDVTDMGGRVAVWKFEVVGLGGATSTAISGSVFVGHAEVFPSYNSFYIVDPATGVAAVNPTAVTGSFASPIYSLDGTKIYFSGPSEHFAVYDIATQVVTVLNSTRSVGMLRANAAQTKFFGVHFGTGDYTEFLPDGTIVNSMHIGFPSDCAPSGGDCYVAQYGGVGYYKIAGGTATYVDTSVPGPVGGYTGAFRGCALRGGILYLIGASLSGSNPGQLSKYSAADGTFLGGFLLPGGSTGYRIEMNPNGSGYAVCSYATTPGLVWIYNAFDVLMHTFSIGANINALKYNASGSQLYVASTNSDELFIIDTASNTVIDTVNMPGEPIGVAVYPNPGTSPDWIAVPDAPDAYWDPDTQQYIVVNASDEYTPVSIYLAAVEAAVCQRCRVPANKFDGTAIAAIPIPGFLIGDQHPGADVLEPLMAAYTHDLPEFDGRGLVARLRGGPAVLTLTEADFLEVDPDEESRKRQGVRPINSTRPEPSEFPAKVSVITQEPQADYAPIPQTASRYVPGLDASSERVINLAVPLPATPAKQMASKILKILWARAEGSLKRTLPMEFTRLIPSDSVIYDNRRWLIEKTNYANGALEINASYERTESYDSNDVGVEPPAPTPPTSSIISPTIFAVMNLPRLYDAQTSSGVVVAAQGVSAAWSGADIYMSEDGLDYTLVKTVTSNSKMGKLTANEPVGPGGSPITVKLNNPAHTLSAVTAEQVAFGRNHAAIVGTNDIAEIIGFTTPTDTGGSVWSLTGISRAMDGTTEADHVAGDKFVPLDEAVFIPVNSALAGRVLYFRAVSRGASVDSGEIITLRFMPQFTAPATVEFYTDQSGNLYVDQSGSYYKKAS